jgi:hypothetical protein
MNDEQLRKEVVMALRQVEIVKAQTELLHLNMIDLALQVGIQIVDPSQLPAKQPEAEPIDKKV